jgi:hypothetical protein
MDIGYLGIPNTPYLYFAVMPDFVYSLCRSNCARGVYESAFNNMIGVATHEFHEAVTDPAIGNACCLGYPLGWYDLTYNEIGIYIYYFKKIRIPYVLILI